MTREVRLKKRFAALYHCLRPGVWKPAAATVDEVRACVLKHPGPAGLVRAGRLLEDEHFEFRGGSPHEEDRCTRDGEW
jgi:hypothetical protein